MDNIEVYKQCNGFATQLKVRKDLGLMDRGDCFNGFNLHYDEVLNQQVHTIAQIELVPAIDNWQSHLSVRPETRVSQFELQTGNVGTFDRNHEGREDQFRFSKIPAAPMPPPTHIVTRP